MIKFNPARCDKCKFKTKDCPLADTIVMLQEMFIEKRYLWEELAIISETVVNENSECLMFN